MKESTVRPRPGRNGLPRGIPRGVDRFEAQRLRKKGLTFRQIGVELGANAEAVRQALMTPEQWTERCARQRAVKLHWWRYEGLRAAWALPDAHIC